LAVRGAASLSDLAGEPIVCVLRNDIAGDHNPLIQQLRQHGLEPVVGQWASNPEEMIDLVMVSGGICVTPASTIQSTPTDQLIFRALPEFASELELRIGWVNPPATPTMASFVLHLNGAIDRHQAALTKRPPEWCVLDGVNLLRATD
jgi:DNA-binding transcriptional LysR family regulator